LQSLVQKTQGILGVNLNDKNVPSGIQHLL
jgi:hypothetical protein